MSHPLRSALATIVPAAAVPYGYTLAIWSCGAVLLRSEGTPSRGDVLLFLAGAIAGFNMLGLLAIGVTAREMPLERRRDRVLAGALDWIALGAVVGVVMGVTAIHGWAAWALGPFTATVVYLLMASLQLAVSAVRRKPERRTAPK